MAQPVVETRAIAERFNRDGFHFPLHVLSEGEALGCRAELERLEARIVIEELGHKNQINHGHVVFRFASDLIRHPRILDAVESILGPDILCWSSTFFTKEPRSPSYVSWHQDLRYWGPIGRRGGIGVGRARTRQRGTRLHALRARQSSVRDPGTSRHV